MRSNFIVGMMLVATVTGANAAEGPSPVRVLTTTEAQALPAKSGVMQVFPTGPDFRTAASVVTTASKQIGETKVQRGQGTTSTVYSGLGAMPPDIPAQLAPPPPSTGQVMDFKTSANSVQAWAAVTAEGAPFLMVKGAGRFTGNADTAWKAKLHVPTGLTHDMYVQFAIPSVNVAGTYEGDGPSKFRTRMKAQLLLNGHEVWHSEAMRFNESDALASTSGQCSTAMQHAVHLNTYGNAPPFPGAPDGFGPFPSQPVSAMLPRTIYLGSFAGSTDVELQLILHAEATVEGECCQKMKDGKLEQFCTQAVSSVDYDPTAAPKFYVH